MILCDIGNTYLHFSTPNGNIKILPEKLDKRFENQRIYYISVSQSNQAKLLYFYKNAIDISEFIQIDTLYQGMGVDRKAACVSVKDGLVVDAGSAITLDVMHEGLHLGGCILPGLFAYLLAYQSISPSLKKDFNFGLSLSELPQNTQDAISYGVFSGIIEAIKAMARGKQIFFTGGDGKFFCNFFKESIYDEGLIFRGMKQCIQGVFK